MAHVRVGAPMYSTSRDIASARLRALSTSGAGGISQSGGKQATVLLGKYSSRSLEASGHGASRGHNDSSLSRVFRMSAIHERLVAGANPIGTSPFACNDPMGYSLQGSRRTLQRHAQP